MRAGVGTTTLVDRDLVDLTNLQRQTLFTEADARTRRPKAEAAKERLAQVNSEVRVRAWVEEFSPLSALRITEGATLLIDCLDNFESRLLLNDVAVQRGLPMVYGGAVGMRGMAALLFPRLAAPSAEPAAGPCFRCLVPVVPPMGSAETCDSAGVLSSATGVAASLQAALALRTLAAAADSRESLANVLTRFDLEDFSFGRTDIHEARDPACPCCARGQFDFLNAAAQSARVLCGRYAVQIAPAGSVEDAQFLGRLAERLRPHGAFTIESGALRGQLRGEVSDSGANVNLIVFPDGRVIVEGTTEPEFARSIAARFVGG